MKGKLGASQIENTGAIKLVRTPQHAESEADYDACGATPCSISKRVPGVVSVHTQTSQPLTEAAYVEPLDYLREQAIA
jgi:hypothetical protein